MNPQELQPIPISRNAWISYQENWLCAEEANALMNVLIEEEAWEQRSIVALGKERIQPRLMSWAGDLEYKYSGQTLPIRHYSKTLLSVQQQVSDYCGHAFNHVVINRYRDGRDHMSLHADNEPELGRNPLIAALSLGVPRRFMLQHKNKKYKGGKRKVVLHHGSLLIMGGDIQHTWRHSVPQTGGPTGERINITFRWLHGPPGWRGQKEEKN